MFFIKNNFFTKMFFIGNARPLEVTDASSILMID